MGMIFQWHLTLQVQLDRPVDVLGIHSVVQQTLR